MVSIYFCATLVVITAGVAFILGLLAEHIRARRATPPCDCRTRFQTIRRDVEKLVAVNPNTVAAVDKYDMRRRVLNKITAPLSYEPRRKACEELLHAVTVAVEAGDPKEGEKLVREAGSLAYTLADEMWGYTVGKGQHGTCWSDFPAVRDAVARGFFESGSFKADEEKQAICEMMVKYSSDYQDAPTALWAVDYLARHWLGDKWRREMLEVGKLKWLEFTEAWGKQAAENRQPGEQQHVPQPVPPLSTISPTRQNKPTGCAGGKCRPLAAAPLTKQWFEQWVDAGAPVGLDTRLARNRDPLDLLRLMKWTEEVAMTMPRADRRRDAIRNRIALRMSRYAKLTHNLAKSVWLGQPPAIPEDLTPTEMDRVRIVAALFGPQGLRSADREQLIDAMRHQRNPLDKAAFKTMMALSTHFAASWHTRWAEQLVEAWGE